jgi:hypothetical protein
MFCEPDETVNLSLLLATQLFCSATCNEDYKASIPPHSPIPVLTIINHCTNRKVRKMDGNILIFRFDHYDVRIMFSYIHLMDSIRNLFD